MTRSQLSLAVMVALAAILLFSCSATKRATRHLDKAFKADSATVANRVRAVFPCITLYRTDTVNTTTEHTVTVDCPPSPAHYDTIVTDGRTVTVYVPQKPVTRTVTVAGTTSYINHYFEDSAKIFTAQHATQVLQAALTKRNSQYQSLRTVMIWLIVGLGVSLIGNVLLIKFRK